MQKRTLEEARDTVRPVSLFAGAGRLGFDGRAAVAALRGSDPKLCALIDRVGPFRLKCEAIHSPYEALFEAVCYQQLTPRAAATIAGRVCALSGDGRFPSPARVSELEDERLRAAGLSRPKIRAIRDLAAKAIDGTVPGLAALLPLSDAEIVERLTAVRGIGRWTVEMLLIFRLGRADVLPIHDYGLRKGFAIMLGRRGAAKPDVIERRGEKWRPFRTVASWYLWRANEL